jgi:hypothetical protein
VATNAGAAGKALSDYYEDSLERFTGWIKHQDSKAAFALVVLGIGRATSSIARRRSPRRTSWEADGAMRRRRRFGVPSSSASSPSPSPWLTVRPRTKRGEETRSSVYFFRSVAEHRSAKEYEAAVKALSEADMEEQLAGQVWELAKHADTKVRYARSAYVTVALFLVLWGAARVFLALAT